MYSGPSSMIECFESAVQSKECRFRCSDELWNRNSFQQQPFSMGGCEAPSVLCDILQCTLLVYAEDLLLGISTI